MANRTTRPEADAPDQVEAFDPLPGELLQEARKRKRWTRARVAEEMNLDVGVIDAMEENRFEDLGAPVFARGHLRKYARLLGLEADVLLQAYATIESERMPPPDTTAEGLTMTGGESRRHPGWLGIAIIVILGLAALLFWQNLSEDGEDGEDETPPVDTIASGEGMPPAATEMRDEPVAVPLEIETPALRAPEPAPERVQPEPIGTRTVSSQAPTPDRPPAESQAAETEPAIGSAAAEPAADLSVLRLRFDAESWVEVRDRDGDRLVYQLGRAGQQRTVTGTAPFEIFLGYADGVEIELDGEVVAVPSGRLGRTARFRLPAEAAADSQ